MRRRLEIAVTLARTFGVYGAWQRARFVARRMIGGYRADPTPASLAMKASPVPSGWPFAASPARVKEAADRDEALDRADRVLRGEHFAYRAHWRRRPATAEEWAHNPETGWRYDPDAPWWTVPHYARGAGDVKEVWEASRFAWAYDLARAWILTRDDRHAEEFWRGLEVFLAGARPFRGIHWACGQECAIRSAAWLWAEGALHDAPSSTPERLDLLHRALAWSAERIDDAHEWGASQRNNHGISDAVGLITIGARLLGEHPAAARWMDRGTRLLERYVLDQFAEDGWFVQHSMTYARLALEQAVQAQRALAFRGRSLSPASLERLRIAAELLGELMDPATGHLPLHGANDGAYVLPLSCATYRDFRPALTATAATFGAAFPTGASPDAEVLAWLGRDTSSVRHAAPRTLPHLRTGASGWVHVVTQRARLFARAASYSSRPGHIDPLHVDVWIDGQPVATDAGTFRYGEPFFNALAGVEVHNTVSIIGHPPAIRGPRFLWLTWPKAAIRSARIEPLTGDVLVALENLSWHRQGIRHLRECRVVDGGVEIVDRVSANAGVGVRAALHWLLDSPTAPVLIEAPSEADVQQTSGDEKEARGWISEVYGGRRPAESRLVTSDVPPGGLRLTTRFGDLAYSRAEEALSSGAVSDERGC